MEYHQAAYANPALYREVGQLGRDAATRAYAMAGVGPHDVDVFSLYDPNSFEIIRQLEILGLCAEGEGGPLAAVAPSPSAASTPSTRTAAVCPTPGTGPSR